MQSLPCSLSLGKALESPLGHGNGHLPGDVLVGTLLLHRPFSGGGRGAGKLGDCGGAGCPVSVVQELAGTGAQEQGSPASSSCPPGEKPLGYSAGYGRAQLT